MKITTLQKICQKYNLKQHVSLNDVYHFYDERYPWYIIAWEDDFIPVYGTWSDGFYVNKKTNELDYDGNRCMRRYPCNLTTVKEVERHILDVLARLKALSKEVRMNRIKEL